MPTSIPAHGNTLHLEGVCVNRIGTISTSDNHILIAIGGTRWVSADTKDRVWVNPNTGSRKMCAPEDLTELISIDPETLAVVQTNVVQDINISAVTEDVIAHPLRPIDSGGRRGIPESGLL